MSSNHVVKELRHRLRAVLEGSALSVDVAGVPTPVTVLRRPPQGLQVDERKLPALYLFNGGEQITDRNLYAVDRSLQLEIILLAREKGDPQDQLDDMQLAIEQAIIASDNLSGACHEIPYEGSTTAQDQGRVLFGVRSLTFRPTSNVTADDPSF